MPAACSSSPLPARATAPASKDRAAAPLPGHPIDHHVAGAALPIDSSVHRDKAGRPRTTSLPVVRRPLAPDWEPPLTCTRLTTLVRGEQHGPILAAVKVIRPQGAPP